MFFYILVLALSFYSRRIFLECLGAGFIGLTGTLTNLLGFLNLAELGVSSAIAFVLYKPLFEKNQEKICELISIMGFLYRWIGIVILCAGIILSFFLPVIYPYKNTGFSNLLVFFAYYAFLSSSLIGYFINYRQILLSADQRNYVLVETLQTTNIIKVVIQIVLAYYTRSYWIWIIIELSFAVIYSLFLNKRINHFYGWLKTDLRKGKKLLKNYPEITRYVKQIFFQKICEFANYQLTPILIYSFVSLPVVALYGNYELVFTKTNQLIHKSLDGINASIGNLIAEGNKPVILKVFWELLCLRNILGGILIFGFYNLSDSFILLWLGKEYVMSHIVVIMILLPTLLGMTGGCVLQFLAGFGLFYDLWAAIAQTVLFITTALLGGYLYGLPGVLSGTVISYFFILCIWKPYFLFSKGFKISVIKYWGNWFLYMILIAITWIIVTYAVLPLLPWNPSESFAKWIIYALSSVGTYSIILILLFYITTNGTRNLVSRIIQK